MLERLRLDLHHFFFINQTFLRFYPTCFARRKTQEILIYQKFVQIKVIVIFFFSLEWLIANNILSLSPRSTNFNKDEINIIVSMVI